MALRHEASAAWSSHGSAAVIEFPRRVAEEPQILRRLQGTAFSQVAGTDNWIHLPVPTAFKLDGRFEPVIGFGFAAVLNENARIGEVRLSNGSGTGVPTYQQEVSFVGERVEYEGRFPERLIQSSGVVISLHVEFLSGTPIGRAELQMGRVFTRHH